MIGGAGLYSSVLRFLSELFVYDPYSILSDLITTCTCLPLKYLPSDRYGNLFNKLVMLFLLILRMLFCIFLLLSITSTLMFCLAK